MKKSSAQKTGRGFTLIELLVSVAIIAVLTSIAIAGFSNLSISNDVTLQVQDISSQARKIRNDALASKFPTGCAISGTSLPIFYGTYLSFSTTTNTQFETGSVCDNGGLVLAKVGNTITNYASLVTHGSLKISTSGVNDVSIVYLKTGVIKLLNDSLMTKSVIIAAPAVGDPATASVVFSKAGTGSRQLNFNSAGLICEEKASASPSCIGP